MAKRDNPLFRSSDDNQTITVQHADGIEVIPLNETFPAPVAPFSGRPLSLREKDRLAELEDVVTRNFSAFYDVGCALREISERKLYRDTHRTFADYAKDLWDMARRRAYQMIDAADVVDRLAVSAPEMSTIGRHPDVCTNGTQIPQNERQARALAKYPAEKQIEIWREAVSTAEGRITAAHVKRTARRLHGQVVRKKIKQARREHRGPEIRMSQQFSDALDIMLDAISEELNADWKNTDRQVAARYVRGILQAIEAEI